MTVIVDGAAGYLLPKEIDCIIVGADRVAANGDVANKIGTYTMAVLAEAIFLLRGSTLRNPDPLILAVRRSS